MTWQAAVVIGSIGISFYVLYLQTLLQEKHEHLKTGLMIFSMYTILFGLQQITEMITISEPTALDNIALANSFYSVFTYFIWGFTAYWFIFIAGKWIYSWKKI